jgi:hypothetical protein
MTKLPKASRRAKKTKMFSHPTISTATVGEASIPYFTSVYNFALEKHEKSPKARKRLRAE